MYDEIKELPQMRKLHSEQPNFLSIEHGLPLRMQGTSGNPALKLKQTILSQRGSNEDDQSFSNSIAARNSQLASKHEYYSNQSLDIYQDEEDMERDQSQLRLHKNGSKASYGHIPTIHIDKIDDPTPLKNSNKEQSNQEEQDHFQERKYITATHSGIVQEQVDLSFVRMEESILTSGQQPRIPTSQSRISGNADMEEDLHEEFREDPDDNKEFTESQRHLIIPDYNIEDQNENSFQPDAVQKENGNKEMFESAFKIECLLAGVEPEENLPELLLRSKSKEISFSLKYMNKIGASEINMLKDTVFFNFHGSVKLYSRNSLKIFDASSKFRQKIIWFVEWKYFDWFILFIILLNSITLTLFDYKDRESLTSHNQLLDNINLCFTVIYSIESILKIIAQGFVGHKRAYLREHWNKIDFVVALSGIIEVSFGSSSRQLRTLRTIRVLRPLKSVNSLAGIKQHVETLINALPNFFNVAVFLIFIFALFAILGLHQYGEAFYNRCRINPEPEEPGVSWAMVEEDGRACTLNGLGRHKCELGQTCGNPYQYGIPLENEGVSDNPQIFYGITHFGNIASSLLLVNQMVSTDDWSSFMYNLMDVDRPAFAIIYSIVMIIIGNFFIMNLILAVIIDTFVNIQEKEQKKQERQLVPEIVISDSEFTPESAEIGRKNKEVIGAILEKARKPSSGISGNSYSDSDTGSHKGQSDNASSLSKTLRIEAEKLKQYKEGKVQEEGLDDDMDGGNDPQFFKKSSQPISNLSKPKVKISRKQTHSDSRSGFSEEQEEEQEEADDEGDGGEVNEERISQELGQSQNGSPINKAGSIGDSNSNQSPRVGSVQGDWEGNASAKESSKENKQESQLNRTLSTNQQKQLQQLDQHLHHHHHQDHHHHHSNPLLKLQNPIIAEKIKKITEKQRTMLDVVQQRYQQLVRADRNKLFCGAYFIISSQYFGIFISAAIIMNTVAQSLDQYPEPAYFNKLDQINSFFSVIFIFELVLKLFGLGFKFYFQDPFNTFDCFIVMTSFADIIISSLFVDVNVNAVTALRTFRLLRIFKLAKTWKQFQHLLKTMWKTLVDISTFSVLLFLFMFIYSILGMEVFAQKAKFKDDKLDMENGESIDQNFDSFLWSFTTVFVLLTEDGWSAVFYQYFRAVGGFRANLYFLSLFIIGPRILLNLFLCILLQNFDDDSMEEEKDKKNSKKIDDDTIDESELTYLDKAMRFMRNYLRHCFKTHKVKVANDPNSFNMQSKSISMNFSMSSGQNPLEDSKVTPFSGSITSVQRQITQKLKKSETNKYVEDLFLQGTSLNMFTEDNPIRLKLFEIINSRAFEQFIIIFIFLSSVQLALTNPLNDPNGSLYRSLYWIDFFTTIVFLIECLMKIITYGFAFNGQPSYLKNPWNLLDFIIIVLSIVSISPIANRLQVFKMFRILRALRLISRAEGLRIGLQALVQAIPNVLRIVMIMVLFFIIFGIIAISYFKGRFYSCQNDFVTPTIPDYDTIFTVRYKWDCLNTGAEWTKRYYTFDNMYQAIASLFIISNVSGWIDFMYIGAQVTEIDEVWRKWNHPYWVFFFIVFMIIGSFFLLNLFVGIVISSFNRQKDKLGGTSQLTDLQKEWVDTYLTILKQKPIKKPRMPASKFGCWCYRIYDNKNFDTFIYICIILNTLILMLKWEGQSNEMMLAVDIMNYIFTGIFVMEMLIKQISMGALYFYEMWNIFDFLIVLVSIATISLDYLSSISLGSSTTVVRAFRISKILRLIKRSKSLKHIFNTFIVSLKPLANIGSLLLLILYMYAIAGVILFGQVQRNGKLNDSLNFETFSAAALALFVISTTDAWTDIGISCLRARSIDFDCVPNPTYDDYVDNDYNTVGCGPRFSGVLYFYSFFLLMSLILLKLFIAIILEAYDDIKKRDAQLFNDERMDKFNEAWQYFDPDATGFIPIYELRDFLKLLGSPLGFSEQLKNGVKKDQDQFIFDLVLPTYKNFSMYNYTDILDRLALRLTVYDNVKRDRIARTEELLNDNKVTEEESEIHSEFSQDDNQKANEVEEKPLNTEEECSQEREKLVHYINGLLISDKSAEILVLKEIEYLLYVLSETRKDEEFQDKLSSKHQIWAGRAAFRMKRFVIFQKRERKRLAEMPSVQSDPPTESDDLESSERSIPHSLSLSEASQTREEKNASIENKFNSIVFAKQKMEEALALQKMQEKEAALQTLKNLASMGQQLKLSHKRALDNQEKQEPLKIQITEPQTVKQTSTMKEDISKLICFHRFIKRNSQEMPQTIQINENPVSKDEAQIHDQETELTPYQKQEKHPFHSLFFRINPEASSLENIDAQGLESARSIGKRTRLRSAVARKQYAQEDKCLQQKVIKQRPITARRRTDDDAFQLNDENMGRQAMSFRSQSQVTIIRSNYDIQNEGTNQVICMHQNLFYPAHQLEKSSCEEDIKPAWRLVRPNIQPQIVKNATFSIGRKVHNQ